MPGETLERAETITDHLAEITLSQSSPDRWLVEFAFTEPKSAILLPRSQTDYRSQSWQSLDQNVRIKRYADADVIVFGIPAKSAKFSVAPWFEVLPRDYTPALDFGDGIAFHFGQFEMFDLGSEQVAQALEPDLSNLTGNPLPFALIFETSLPVIAHGEVALGPRRFASRYDPGYVYIGEDAAKRNDEYILIIDSRLPDWIKNSVDESLGRTFDFMDSRFSSSLPHKPTILFSFEGYDRFGRSLGGSTLAGPTLTLAVGGKAFSTEPSAELKIALERLIAHEIAHLYQKRLAEPKIRDVWIFEGHADAVANDFITGKTNPSPRQEAICDDVKTSSSSVLEALTVAPYECGSVIWHHIDEASGAATIYDIYDSMVRKNPSASDSDEFLCSIVEDMTDLPENLSTLHKHIDCR